MMRRTTWTFAPVLGAAFVPALLGAQQATGTVTGRITDAANGRPIPAAQVQVVGTSLGAITNDQGTYTLRAVPARAVTIRVLRVGYTERTGTVTVTAGQTATLNLAMTSSAISLTPVVTTATGEQRRVEVPSAIATVDAKSIVEERQITNVGELLQARAAGVQVLPGSQIGAGARIRIRGTTTLNLSNNPIVFIDGVRMDAAPNRQVLGVGGTAAGSLNDLNPDEIENIEVVRGPSASALYGTDAANGVIVITTKRGRAGRTQVAAYTQQALNQDPNRYPDAVFNWGTNPVNGQRFANSCSLNQIGQGACRSDSVTRANVFDDPRATPLQNGWLREYGVNVSGGTQSVRYFVAGETMGQDGLFGLPEFERARATRQGGPGLADEWLNPNRVRNVSGRANLDLTWNKAQVQINTNYIDRNTRFPQNDNNVTGLYAQARFGPGTRNRLSATGDSLLGYNNFLPLEVFQQVNRSQVQRFIGSMRPTYTPTSWLTLRSNAGLDVTSQTDDEQCLNSQCTEFGTNRQGFRQATRARNFVYTVDGSATATWRPQTWLNSTTTGGVQWVSERFDRNGAFGELLPPGALTVGQASIQTADEATTVSRTQGAFVEQRVDLWDKLFLNGRLRADNNSAFGRNFTTEYYPAAGLSYVISEESWMPFKDQIQQLRLRTSWGQSGQRPGTTAALPFFASSNTVIAGANTPGLIFQTLGNVELRPATVTEFEYGIDATLFNGRVTAEVTRYDKRTSDDLINRVLPGSFGTGATARFENIGAVRNWGTELLLNTQPIQRRNFGWDFLINGSWNDNRLQSLGGVPSIIGATIRQVEGFPLNGWWARPYTFNDANGDNIITAQEIRVAPADSAQFRGYSQPRTELVFQNGFDFFNKRLRFVAMADYKGGYRLLNTTERFRCTDFPVSADRNDPRSSLERQARCVAALAGANQTFWGYMEDASFVRLRELSVSTRVPDRFLTRLGGIRSANIVFAARNLALWTDWTGIDPEASFGQGNVSDELLTAPPPRTFALRVNVGF